MKKLLEILFAVLLCAILLPALASAETSGTCGDNLTWVLDDEGTLTISGTGAMTSHPWTVSDTVSDIKKVIIEDGVTSIGDISFSDCGSLTNVTIPESVTRIGSQVFVNCSKLTSVRIPKGVTGIDDYLFSGCSSLTSVTIPEGVRSIGGSAFCGCSSLTSVAIPEGVTSIKSQTFSGCSRLTSVTIPGGVRSIGDSAFSYCSSLTSVTIPEGVRSIGDSAFFGCSRMTSVTIPEGVRSIGVSAFSFCSSLTSVMILEGVRSIGVSAFYGCSRLTSVTIPESVTSIDEDAFAYCDSLSKLAILSNDSVSVNFGTNVCKSYKPTVYCYEYSDADSWATDNKYPIVYLDSTDMNPVRTMTLPDDFRLALGETRKLDPEVFPSYNAEVVWSSSDPNVVTVDGGLVTAVGAGTATISATVGTVSDSVDVTVYVAAESFNLNIEEDWLVAKDGVQLFPIDILPTGSETSIAWSSSDTSLATVDENGLVTTKKPGDVTISADDGDIHRECLLHLYYPVTAIAFDEESLQLGVGTAKQLTANVTMRTQSCVNHLVTFSSSDNTVAMVSPEGVATANALGTATITATAASGVSGEVEITVVDCGEIGHAWGEATYEWSEDNKSVTATRACANDESHVETEIVSVTREVTKPATCEGKGETTYTSAAFENKAFAVQTKTLADVPALGHAWGKASYKWSEDNKSVTATRICANDAEHVETETVDVTSKVTKDATCEAKGETTYTSAAFKNAAFAVQMKTLADVPALGHAWGEATYEWSEDNKNVTATRVCANDESHVETETVAVTGEVTKDATCEVKGETTYTSAEFKNEAFPVQTKILEDVPALGHDWNAPTYAWSDDYKSVTATVSCKNGDHPVAETVNTTAEQALAPTYFERGKTTYTAKFENPLFAEQSKTVDDIPMLEKDAEVKEAEAKIEALSESAGLDDVADVAEARAAYNALTDEQKKQIGEDVLAKLTEAETSVDAAKRAADEKAAQAVADAIGKLSDSAGVDDKEAVEAAREAYDALTDDQKKLVGEDVLAKLEKAEASVRAAEQAAAKQAADEKAAQAVADAIGKLSDSAGVDDKEAVEAARKAYEALTDDQKKLVGEDVLAELKEAEASVKVVEEAAAKQAADEKAAQAVADAIGKLSSSAGVDDKEAVEAVRKAYDALTDDQKKLVDASAVTKLATAEASVKTAEEEAAKQPTATPTATPTEKPTAAPTATPTEKPTTAPTEQPAPTAAPLKSIADCAITVKDQTYTGKALKPAVTVKSGKTTLVLDTDYTVTYANNKAAGTATATVTGIGGYTGSKEVNFKIAAVKMSKLTYTVKNQTYTGKVLKPAVTVKFGKTKLKKGTDYTVTYKNNKKIGTATVTVKGKGNFTGTKKVTFKINPKGTKFSKLTGGNKQVTLKWKNPKNITGYEVQYSLKKDFSGKKTVKIKKAKTLTTTIKKLKSGKKYYVRIRTYKVVGKKTYYSAWSKAKTVKVKGASANTEPQAQDTGIAPGPEEALIDIEIGNEIVDGIADDLDGALEMDSEEIELPAE